MATYGRGRLILPSVRSVLAQTDGRLELLVVGDDCHDETRDCVLGCGDARVRWLNLDQRCGSQSGPNNAGIAAARGEVIAYLGHDDIWAPDHLESLGALFAARPEVGLGVAGAVLHWPKGVPGAHVTGLFAEDADKHVHFFPPSSFAHRRAVVDRIGPWHMPQETRGPVDADFLLRAAAGGVTFAATGRITVHKFAAAQRYLSYLCPSAEEQEAMLADMAAPGHAERVAGWVEDARRAGGYMTLKYDAHWSAAPGELWRQNMARKGLAEAAVRPLGKGAVIRQEKLLCAFDWVEEPEDGIRWTLRNPRPRMLVPFQSAGAAVAEIRAYHRKRAGLKRLALSCNGQGVAVKRAGLTKSGGLWQADFRVILPLKPDGPTVLEFDLAADQVLSAEGKGIGIGTITIVPAAWWSGRERGLRARVARVLNRWRLDQQRPDVSRLDRGAARRHGSGTPKSRGPGERDGQG